MDQDKSRKNRVDASRGPLLLLSYAGALEAPETGRRFILDGDELIIGRSSDAHIQVDRDSVSRRHARLSKVDGGWQVQDLQSTNGSYVNDVPIREHKLAPGDQLKVGSAIFRYLAGSSIETLLRRAVSDRGARRTDPRAQPSSLRRSDGTRVHRAHKLLRPLTLLAIDIDHIKQVNDNYGHLSGDFVIKELALSDSQKCERFELLCRYEGT